MSFFSAKKKKTTGRSSVAIQIIGKNKGVVLRGFSLCIRQPNGLTSSDTCLSARYLHSWHACKQADAFLPLGSFHKKSKREYFQT